MAHTARSKKQKGTRLEKYVALRLREVLGEYGIDAKRMPMSGAIEGFKSDIYVNLPVSFECKNQEKVSLWEWWEQCQSQAPLGKMPVLVISRNFVKEPIVVLSFEDLLNFMEWAVQAGWTSYIKAGRKIIK